MFENTLIRASAFGLVMTEPQAKSAKDAGELSKTAKSYLFRTYISEKYGREKDITTKQMVKGITQEEEGITMLSRYYGKLYEKNQERYSNEFITGHPDIISQNDDGLLHLHDIKLAWDIWTFMPNIIEPLNKDYYYQLQAYFWLTGAKTGEINYILVDASEKLIQDEKYKLLRQMDVVSEESPEYIEAAAQAEINMIYPDIPLEEKILVFPVERDDEVIEKMQQKVIKCREFLQQLENNHVNFNKTPNFG